ncbi:S-adenosyl-L-methionine-dependent methyltransferase [Conidiobolus coronatus NRRL 28638]|uniref:S-adenosyl-L-methionine-dependent methyltransferase n=1 Tax=Conidiobolus coronatus (strain ATCC 28846 / CBS 209.66 / NRRL 28638) TaxID=796925 RepID=A0A137NYQ6_CONC2|nr:S-adenosyl-L-methionine-dependent methyltransferase [Conidiobolus coronatus NRRL 28638]|eukprot:KXN67945.1 S-adenosyl-L-methionine-dependent methyltransferase [Conidiobolus coronatus NRRL 28638]
MEVENIERGSHPMKDYNKASSMQLRVIENCYNNMEILTDNLKLKGDQLAVGDLGCSHGRNSMTAINQLLGLVEKNESISSKLKKLIVYHEDLEDNDFDQVQQCLNDKSISYLNNSYIANNNISTSVEFVPKSFFEPLFEPGSIDVIMCYTAIHWLPKYKSLTRGLWFQDQMETPENIEWFRKLSKDCLINWLNLRYEELATNGLITVNIMESSGVLENFNLCWDEYLALKGFSHTDLDKVNVAGILRSAEEVNSCLSQFQSKFKILRNHQTRELYKFGRDHLIAILSGQVIHGLSNYPELFPTKEAKTKFFEGFLDYFYNVKKCPIETKIGFVFLVLQKI